MFLRGVSIDFYSLEINARRRNYGPVSGDCDCITVLVAGAKPAPRPSLFSELSSQTRATRKSRSLVAIEKGDSRGGIEKRISQYIEPGSC